MNANEEVAQLENSRWQAMLAADLAMLDRLLAPQLAYTHSNMTTDDKASYLKKLADGFYQYQTIHREQETIRIAGDTAIITGHLRASILAGGQPRNLNNLYLAVWARVNGTWQFIAYQPTVFPANG